MMTQDDVSLEIDFSEILDPKRSLNGFQREIFVYAEGCVHKAESALAAAKIAHGDLTFAEDIDAVVKTVLRKLWYRGWILDSDIDDIMDGFVPTFPLRKPEQGMLTEAEQMVYRMLSSHDADRFIRPVFALLQEDQALGRELMGGWRELVTLMMSPDWRDMWELIDLQRDCMVVNLIEVNQRELDAIADLPWYKRMFRWGDVWRLRSSQKRLRPRLRCEYPERAKENLEDFYVSMAEKFGVQMVETPAQA